LFIFRTRPLFTFLGLTSISVCLTRASFFLIDNQHSKVSLINMYHDPVSGTPPSSFSPSTILLLACVPATPFNPDPPPHRLLLFISLISQSFATLDFTLHFQPWIP
jgi:hypothetical protein